MDKSLQPNNPLYGYALLRSAIDWMKANGPLQLIAFSKSPEGEKFCFDLFNTTKPIQIGDKYGVMELEDIEANGIPILAALSLGCSIATINKLYDGFNCNYGSLYRSLTDYSATYALSDETTGSPLSINEMVIRLTQAAALNHKELTDIVDLHKLKHISRISLAAMHTNHSTYWPCSIIKDQGHMMRTGNYNQLEYPADFLYLMTRPEVITQLPDSSPIEMAVRSGLFTDEVLNKEGVLFSMWEDLICFASNDELGGHSQVNTQNAFKYEIVRGLSMISDPGLNRAVHRGLVSISSDVCERTFEVTKTIRLLTDFSHQSPAFAAALNSPTLIINLFRSDEYPFALDEMADSPNLYTCVLKDQHMLLSRVAAELLSFNHKELGYAQLSIGTKLAAMPLPPQQFDFSPEQVVLHMLKGFRANGHSKETERGIISLVGVLARHHNFDYAALSVLPSEDKHLLILAGLDIQKMPGLSNEHKGLILEEYLGL
jgi:hypothetical protein